MWEYRAGGLVPETKGMRLDSWILPGKGKVWKTHSSLYPYEAYWDNSKKSKRFKMLRVAQLHVEDQTK
jgi:hypothetical protein